MKTYELFLLVGLLGCSAAAHTADRAENAVKAGDHQVELESCLKQASASKAADAGATKILADYDACQTAADAKAGKK